MHCTCAKWLGGGIVRWNSRFQGEIPNCRVEFQIAGLNSNLQSEIPVCRGEFQIAEWISNCRVEFQFAGWNVRLQGGIGLRLEISTLGWKFPP